MTASSRQLKNDGCPRLRRSSLRSCFGGVGGYGGQASRRSLKKIGVGLINRGARWAATGGTGLSNPGRFENYCCRQPDLIPTPRLSVHRLLLLSTSRNRAGNLR